MTVQDDETLWVLKEGEDTIEQATNRLISTINYRIDKVDPLVNRIKLLEQSKKVTTAIENLNVSVIGQLSGLLTISEMCFSSKKTGRRKENTYTRNSILSL